MKTFTEILKTFWRDEDGMEMTEYAVVGAALVIGAATSFGLLKNAIGTTINNIIAAM